MSERIDNRKLSQLEGLTEVSMPTFEEFYAAVRQGFKKRWKTLSEEEADRYIDSEKEYIKVRYNSYLERYNRGDLTLKQFQIGAVASTAHCLEMMY